MTTLATVDVAASSDPTDLTVVAIDERRRHFLYHFRTSEDGGELLALQVEGHVVRATNAESSLRVPATIRQTLERDRSRPEARV